ncbi:MAG: divalent metal cation transporter [Sphingomonadales bacterium]
MTRRKSFIQRLKRPAFLTALGPGLVTGAADDDPSGIATYSQAGAVFGLSLLWTVVLTLPFMAVFQSICARIARVTGVGLARNIRQLLPRPVTILLVVMLLAANIFNISADFAAMGAAAALVTGLPAGPQAAALALLSLGLQLFVPYHRYVGLLKWLTLSLFAYVAVVMVVGAPWGQVLRAIVLPRYVADAGMATMVVAVFGTTISPYLFFWQSAQEIEEMALHDKQSLISRPATARAELARIGVDTWVGMGFSNIVALSIMLATAVTLHAHGITNISSAAEAAAALRPIAGDLAFALFAAGILGTGLLAVPVLAGSAAYALSELMGWRAGLELAPRQALGFYGVITLAMAGALGLAQSGIDPIRALVWSAVTNGLVAVPMMAAIMALAVCQRVMGRFAVRGLYAVLGWASVALMALAGAAMIML